MEFWNVESDGAGGFIVYPAYLVGAGVLAFLVLGVLKSIIFGSSGAIYSFAENHSWVVIAILAIVAIIVSVVIHKVRKDVTIPISILSCVALTLSLSLIYSRLVFRLAELFSSFEEVFLVALMVSPLLFVFTGGMLLLEMVLLLLPYVAIFSPYFFKTVGRKAKRRKVIISTIIGVLANAVLILLFCFSKLPAYLS